MCTRESPGAFAPKWSLRGFEKMVQQFSLRDSGFKHNQNLYTMPTNDFIFTGNIPKLYFCKLREPETNFISSPDVKSPIGTPSHTSVYDWTHATASGIIVPHSDQMTRTPLKNQH